MKEHTSEHYIKLSLKLQILIFNLFALVNLNGQILFSPQITATGSVISFIQPKTTFDIYHNATFTRSDYIARNCSDSLYTHSDREGDLNYCLSEFDFTSNWVNDRRFMTWVNNPNPFTIQELEVATFSERWIQVDQVTWRYSYSSGLSNENSNKQTWKFDEKNRLKNITLWYIDFGNEPEMELEYFYNSFGSLERVSTKRYEQGGKVSDLSHQVWYYDNNQRTQMMLSYNGPYRKFNPQELKDFTKKVEDGIRTGEKERTISIDSLHLKVILIYNNGPYGPEQVNYYSEYFPSYDVPVYVSDSIFYNKEGRIKRYVSAKYDFQYRYGWQELNYEYEPRSPHLKEVVFNRYSMGQFQEWTNNKSIQSFSYDSHGRIVSSIEQRYYIKSEYLEDKYTAPQERLLPEDKYDFKYKR